MRFFAMIKPGTVVEKAWRIHDIKSVVYKGAVFKLNYTDRYECLEIPDTLIETLKSDPNITLEAVSIIPQSLTQALENSSV